MRLCTKSSFAGSLVYCSAAHELRTNQCMSKERRRGGANRKENYGNPCIMVRVFNRRPCRHVVSNLDIQRSAFNETPGGLAKPALTMKPVLPAAAHALLPRANKPRAGLSGLQRSKPLRQSKTYIVAGAPDGPTSRTRIIEISAAVDIAKNKCLRAYIGVRVGTDVASRPGVGPSTVVCIAGARRRSGGEEDEKSAPRPASGRQAEMVAKKSVARARARRRRARRRAAQNKLYQAKKAMTHLPRKTFLPSLPNETEAGEEDGAAFRAFFGHFHLFPVAFAMSLYGLYGGRRPGARSSAPKGRPPTRAARGAAPAACRRSSSQGPRVRFS